MSITALINTNYYVPSVSTKPASSGESADISSAENQSKVQAVDESNTKTQAAAETYSSNQENTSSNNSSENSSSSDTPVYTGEEMLSSMKQEKENETGEKVLTEEEQKQVEELKARDMEVKTHEQAHIAAGGSYVRGGATYDYQTGPDGKKYAVGGEVSIDTSPVEGDPQATINKAQVVIKAALAPAEPSGQDRAVASQARQMMASARKELLNEQMNNSDTAVKNDSSNNEENDEKISTNSPLESENNTANGAESNKTGSTEVNTAQNSIEYPAENAFNKNTSESKTNNKNIDIDDKAVQMNSQSLKSESTYIPKMNIAGSGLYQAFSNAGMSPLKNANALTQVAGSLISLMA